jgi:hypothetical protein
VGYSIDHAGWVKQRMAMQAVADVAALAAANAYVEYKKLSDATAAADRFVAHNPVYGNQPTATTTLVDGNTAIKVTLAAPGDEHFAFVLGTSAPTIEVHAVASLPQAGVPCVLALDDGNTNGAIKLDSNARIVTPECTVRTISKGSQALQVRSNANVTAKKICTAGNPGYKLFSNATATPEPHYCPQMEDPFLSVPEPAVGGCTANNLVLDTGSTITLNPGVYCGGLYVKNNTKINFNPGIYVMKNGSLHVDSNAEIAGTGVSFFLTGNNAVIDFDSNVKVNLVAPSSGELAGFLFFEDRDQPLLNVHNFDSNNMSIMEGTVYLSRGIFHSDSNVTIFGSSNYTIITARRVDLNSNAVIALNADFNSSPVPVPGGVANLTIATRLIE